MAKENRHQGGFAGTVFAQQHQNLARFEFQRNSVVGDQRAEAFGDLLELQDHVGHESVGWARLAEVTLHAPWYSRMMPVRAINAIL